MKYQERNLQRLTSVTVFRLFKNSRACCSEAILKEEPQLVSVFEYCVKFRFVLFNPSHTMGLSVPPENGRKPLIF